MGVIPRGNNNFPFFWFPACAVSLACLERKGPFLNWVFQQWESFPDHDPPLYTLLKFILQWASKAAPNTSSCLLQEDECTDRKALWQMDLEESLYHQESSCLLNAAPTIPQNLKCESAPAGNTLQSSLLVSGQTHLDKSCDIYSVIQTHVWWFICSSDSFLLGKRYIQCHNSAGRLRCAKPQI